MTTKKKGDEPVTASGEHCEALKAVGVPQGLLDQAQAAGINLGDLLKKLGPVLIAFLEALLASQTP